MRSNKYQEYSADPELSKSVSPKKVKIVLDQTPSQ